MVIAEYGWDPAYSLCPLAANGGVGSTLPPRIFLWRRFRLGYPIKKCNNPGGDCYWVGVRSNGCVICVAKVS